jgi:hypothetical protein
VAAVVMMGIAMYLIPSNLPREEHPPTPFAPASTPGSPPQSNRSSSARRFPVS